MTRINLVDPEILPNSFLIAEYRELPRVFTLVKNAIDKGKSIKDFKIKDSYVLGNGHVTFFYNKCDWVMQRYQRICDVLIDRDIHVDHNLIESVVMDNMWLTNTEWGLTDYVPTPEEIMMNMARLANSYYKEDVIKYKQPDVKYNSEIVLSYLS